MSSQFNTMSESQCRWGILGTAGIARKNWRSILNSTNSTLSAVASRKAERAQSFIDECQNQAPYGVLPEAVGSYEGLLQRQDVDAVYIPLPTGMRKEWVIRAAEAGKHVMCEKPCALTSDDLAQMTEACSANRVQFMDGVMFMHSRRLPAVEAAIGSAHVGQLRRIASHHAFNADDGFLNSNIRMSSDLEPHGCLGDLGWYNIRFTLWAVGYEMPKEVSGRLLSTAKRDDSPLDVPMELSAEMFFENGVSASFYCSFITENQQWVTVGGNQGFVHVPDFVLPFYGSRIGHQTRSAKFLINGTDFHMEPRDQWHWTPEYSDGHPSAQETRLFQRFSEIVLSGQIDNHWPEIALKTQRVMDAVLTSARQQGAPIEP